jgi:hypothetical protein
MKIKNNVVARKGKNQCSARTLRPLLAFTGTIICLSLASCVDVVEGGHGHYNGASSSYSTYQPGYRITSLPSGYRSETIDGRNYYYHNGAYYKRNSNGYVVAEAPRQSRYYTDYNRTRQPAGPDGRTTYTSYQPGYTTRSLPTGYRSESISGRDYYYHNGAYYLQNSNGYTVTQAPRESRYYTEYSRSLIPCIDTTIGAKGFLLFALFRMRGTSDKIAVKLMLKFPIEKHFRSVLSANL